MGIESAIIGSAVVGAGSSLIGSSRAARSADRAAEMSTAEQRRQFDLVRQDTAPIRQLGNSAIDRINRLYGYAPTQTAPQPTGTFPLPFGGGSFTAPGAAPAAPQGTGQADMSAFFESPDYQFNVNETQRAIDRSAAGRLGVLSGRAVREGERYASGLASREFASFYDRLAQQAGLGVTGIGQSASAGANAANNISNAYQNAGAIRSNAYMAGAQGVNNAVQGGIQNYLYSPVLSAYQKHLGG